METTAGITAGNFATKVYLGAETQTIPTASSYKIYIKSNLSVDMALFGYAHELNNAMNATQLRTLLNNASSNPKNATNRGIYADEVAWIEAKGVYSQITVGIETSKTQLIPQPDNLVNAVIDALSGTITQQAAMTIIFNFIKSGQAIDEAGNSIYQGYLDFYDAL